MVTSKRLEDLSEEELLEEIARRKRSKIVTDKPEMHDIMTNEREEVSHERKQSARASTEGTGATGLPGRTGELHPESTGSESLEIHQGEQIARISEAEIERRASGILPPEREGGQGVRGEPDEERGAGHNRLESSHPAGDTGERNRLEPPAPVSADKDINLTNVDLGYNAGAAARFDANLLAIRTLKDIEGENRKATPAEQKILAKYSGFGDSGMGPAFEHYYGHGNESWQRRHDELKAMTTPEEYQAIEGSRLNAFYTTPEVIKTMWRALDKLGVSKLTNPRVLEPSAGSGRFLGFEPPELTAKSQRVAVELDSLTGRMLKQLYPETETYVMGFERAPIGKDSIDVAISNVPFGNYPVFDRTFKKDRKKLTHSIHNYFFAKTLEELRPGGVLAFITSHDTLDAPSTKPVRQYLASQSDLVSAIRLPNNAFPDTKVCTDIIFMRKRMPEESPGDQTWVDTANQHFKFKTRWDDEMQTDLEVNKYFIKHPEMVMGVPSAQGSMNPHNYNEGEYTVDPAPGISLSDRLNDAVMKVPSNVVINAPRRDMPRAIYGISAKEGTPLSAREGSRIVRDDGKVYIKRGEALENANLSEVEEAKVKKLLAIRDAAKKVIDLQVNDKPNSEVIAAQEPLNALYKEYVTANGPLSSPDNTDLLEQDPDEPFLQALENHNVLDKDKKDLTAADERLVKILKGKETVQASDIARLQMPIFSQRVIHGWAAKPVTDYADAVTVSKNLTGKLDFNLMAERMGKTGDEVIAALRDRNLIYKNPLGDWEASDEYLSGDVREKLRIAQDAASARPNEFNRNVEALKAVQPPDIPAGQIGVRMGAPWIPAKDINTFVKELLKVDSCAGVRSKSNSSNTTP